MTPPMPAEQLVAMLRDARLRTLELVADLDAGRLIGPELDIVNPPLWEIGHVAWFHEFFVLRRLDGGEPRLTNADALYDSSAVPHPARWRLPLPSLARTRQYLDEVLDAMIARLKRPEASGEEATLYLLALFHEDMHGEALVYTRQTLGYPAPALSAATRNAGPAGACPGDAEIPGGRFLLGAAQDAPFAFDNEKWAHPVDVAPFRIARAPVTNAEFLPFVADGGYRDRRLWDEEGWRWREQAGAEHPVYWVAEGNRRYAVRRFDQVEPLAPDQPVIHVNWHEASAWCRWAGRRLPTEAEWELAACGPAAGDARAGRKRRYPWGDMPPAPGRANLDGWTLGPVDVAAHQAGDAACGCRQMLGNVWEWTASRFAPYPEFAPDAYAEYSAPWFGTRRVLRGGGWATRGRMISNTYRNFFTPERRDIFAGFRTVAL
jgi:iron(II)-dependent oxidoreductase